MASATTSSLSTLCTSFSTHCSITHNPKTSSSSNLSFLSPSPFPSHSLTLSFSSPPLPKYSLSATQLAQSPDSETSEKVESSPPQVPTWEKGLFAVVMPNTRIRINSIMGYENYPKVTLEDLKKDKDE
ncbi:unnamed protein product [Lupinus luteus]|uniref:Uncharacterized protein n=1 Tax=Lupinus luteus TaxID=3873 RepID=A0AAV1XFP2_LUPLU